mmetsp:Transcript_1697/g.1849  ORF Transcript_1697/g.1849 Transcript_1697/m.1849 type:complete len:223 (+) Transcript_1697:1042-1710(+)
MAELHAMNCCLMMSAEAAPLMEESIHSLTVRAFNIVSAVVIVLLTTTTKVTSASKPSRALATSTGSTFARNLRDLPAAAAEPVGSVLRASNTNSGPKKEPPMPIHKTLVSFLPVAPTQEPVLTLSVKSAILVSTACTSGTTSAPSTISTLPLGALRATCITALSSVVLICWPEAMAARFCSNPAAPAKSNNIPIVDGRTFSLLKSSIIPSCSATKAAHRSES